MPMDYQQYQDEVTEDILNVLGQAGCQPILFIGSGFSKRYARAPNWEELLRELAIQCPNIDKDFAYYKQKNGDLIQIGTIFADSYREWAWGEGRDRFPVEYFSEKYPPDVFIKYMVSQLLSNLGPKDKSYGSQELDSEIEALKAMNPHAIITTNYDQLLEPLFPEYERIVGQNILAKPFFSIGEIFKIHGCVSDPLSLVLTSQDYEDFNSDKKYLSAKLLTYFAEHPLLFIGYKAEDPNIKNVLYDVSRMFKAESTLSPNIYILEWDSALTGNSYPARERVLNVGDDINVRIKSIKASSFEWVFRAFGNNGTLQNINVKLLRALMARTVNLIRRDIPSRNVEVDYKVLEHSLENTDNFAKVFGITSLDNPSNVNANYPYTLQDVAEKLGYNYWNGASKLIDLLFIQTGFDMKESDNAYHFKLKTGKAKRSFTRKYSTAALELLKSVQNGEAYQLAEGCPISLNTVPLM